MAQKAQDILDLKGQNWADLFKDATLAAAAQGGIGCTIGFTIGAGFFFVK